MFDFLKTKKGFTLAELVVVVAVLGILIAVGVPAYNGFSGRSKGKICSTVMQDVAHTLKIAKWKGKINASNGTKYYLETNADGTAATWSGMDNTTKAYLTEEIDPAIYCPVGGAKLTFTFVYNPSESLQDRDQYLNVEYDCSVH